MINFLLITRRLYPNKPCVLVVVLVPATNDLTRNNFWKEDFILAYSLRGYNSPRAESVAVKSTKQQVTWHLQLGSKAKCAPGSSSSSPRPWDGTAHSQATSYRSLNPLWKQSDEYTQRWVSVVIVNPVKLTMENKHHSHQEYHNLKIHFQCLPSQTPVEQHTHTHTQHTVEN